MEPLTPVQSSPALPPTPKPRPRAALKRKTPSFKQTVTAIMVATNEFLPMETTTNLPDFCERSQASKTRESFPLMEDASDASDQEDVAFHLENVPEMDNADFRSTTSSPILDTALQETLTRRESFSDQELHSRVCSPINESPDIRYRVNDNEDSFQQAVNVCQVTPPPSPTNLRRLSSYDYDNLENRPSPESHKKIKNPGLFGGYLCGGLSFTENSPDEPDRSAGRLATGSCVEAADMELSEEFLMEETESKVPLRFKRAENYHTSDFEESKMSQVEEIEPEFILQGEVTAEKYQNSNTAIRDSSQSHISYDSPGQELSPPFLRRPVSITEILSDPDKHGNRKTVTFMDEKSSISLESAGDLEPEKHHVQNETGNAEQNLLDSDASEAVPIMLMRSNVRAESVLMAVDSVHENLSMAELEESTPILRRIANFDSEHTADFEDGKRRTLCMFPNEETQNKPEIAVMSEINADECIEKTEIKYSEKPTSTSSSEDAEPEIVLRSQIVDDKVPEISYSKSNLSASFAENQEPDLSTNSPPVLRRSKSPTILKDNLPFAAAEMPLTEYIELIRDRTSKFISGDSDFYSAKNEQVALANPDEKKQIQDLSPPVLRRRNDNEASETADNEPIRSSTGTIPKTKTEKNKNKIKSVEEMPLSEDPHLKIPLETTVPPNSPMKSDEELEHQYEFKLQRSRKNVVKKNSLKSKRRVTFDDPTAETSTSTPPVSPPTLRRNHELAITLAIANLTLASEPPNPEIGPAADTTNFIPPFEGDGDYDFVIDREKRTTRMISINEFPVLTNPPVTLPQTIQEMPPTADAKPQTARNAQSDVPKANPTGMDAHTVETRRKKRNVNYTLTYPLPVNKYLLYGISPLALCNDSRLNRNNLLTDASF